MIPFSRQHERWRENKDRIAEEEASLYPGSILFNSHHEALRSILEALGTKQALIPCILSVNASPEILAAVLHAGGAPVLVDIEAHTLQMNPAEVEYVVAEFKDSAILILDRPAATPVNPVLVEIAKDKLPAIVVTTHPPLDVNSELIPEVSFYIFLHSRPNTLVISLSKEHAKRVRALRDGSMGYYSKPVLYHENFMYPIDSRHFDVADYYKATLKTVLEPFPSAWATIVEVPSVQRYRTYLQSCGIESFQAVCPLHTIESVKTRFAKKSDPNYPIAEQLADKLLALPMDVTLEQAQEICKRVKEII